MESHDTGYRYSENELSLGRAEGTPVDTPSSVDTEGAFTTVSASRMIITGSS
ncbi:MAG: hypothetical protein SV377_03955 [Halobacteria archaeon]|nr:hypothetical protein [Halobacteria archaeon]